nr:GNAT family N-acetyltransferase [uncultured Caproiciproducens sp.]
MNLIKASSDDFYIVKTILQATINAVYPNYYPVGVVNFFLSHHSDEHIQKDIEKQNVFILKAGGENVGTGSVDENQINRVFVLPQFQGNGYGTYIMDKLEDLVAKKYPCSILDSSFPAYSMYLQRGYFPTKYNKVPTPNGNILCYYEMEKQLSSCKFS